ncbi:MAG: TrmJ/YjtD family RNA methyltransferase, partial [Thermoplasmata archaeon]
VNPQTEINDEAYKYAMHGDNILKNAKIVQAFDEAIKSMNLVIGTSGISTMSEKHFLRIPKSPEEVAEIISKYNGNVAIVFGREDIGLLNEELEKVDIFLHIKASEKYPVLNITHAAAIIFYEIFKKNLNIEGPRMAEREDLDRLYNIFVDIIEKTRYPEHKKKNTYRMIKKIIGRAGITSWEYHVLIGVLKEIRDQLRQKNSP